MTIPLSATADVQPRNGAQNHKMSPEGTSGSQWDSERPPAKAKPKITSLRLKAIQRLSDYPVGAARKTYTATPFLSSKKRANWKTEVPAPYLAEK
jgi:hypothetical protein